MFIVSSYCVWALVSDFFGSSLYWICRVLAKLVSINVFLSMMWHDHLTHLSISLRLATNLKLILMFWFWLQELFNLSNKSHRINGATFLHFVIILLYMCDSFRVCVSDWRKCLFGRCRLENIVKGFYIFIESKAFFFVTKKYFRIEIVI